MLFITHFSVFGYSLQNFFKCLWFQHEHNRRKTYQQTRVNISDGGSNSDSQQAGAERMGSNDSKAPYTINNRCFLLDKVIPDRFQSHPDVLLHVKYFLFVELPLKIRCVKSLFDGSSI